MMNRSESKYCGMLAVSGGAVLAAILALAPAASADDSSPSPPSSAERSTGSVYSPNTIQTAGPRETLLEFHGDASDRGGVRAASYLPGGPSTSAQVPHDSRPPRSPGAEFSRILPPPSPDSAESFIHGAARSGGASSGSDKTSSIVTPIAGTGVVLGAFLIFAWVLKRSLPKSASPLPGEAVEVLGRAPLAARHVAHLMRVGNKLILVAVSSAGVETLTEITDPVEVDRLTGICGQSHPLSASQSFRGLLQSFAENDRAARSEAAGR
jgi:flagellar biogenesis protein FliO